MLEASIYKYLNEVLGVESIFFENKDMHFVNAKAPQIQFSKSDSVDILFLTAIANDSQKELLDNIIKAMAPKSYKIAETENGITAKVIVVFSENKTLVSTNNTIYTHPLADLLKNTDLKKETWSQMKIAMRTLKEIKEK